MDISIPPDFPPTDYQPDLQRSWTILLESGRGSIASLYYQLLPGKNLRHANVAIVAPAALPRLSFCQLSETGDVELLRPACAYIRVAAS